MTEVVFGYQMTDEAQAQDSVFAAGLMRLKNTHKKNAEAIHLRKIEKAKARGYLYHQNPIYSTLGTNMHSFDYYLVLLSCPLTVVFPLSYLVTCDVNYL